MLIPRPLPKKAPLALAATHSFEPRRASHSRVWDTIATQPSNCQVDILFFLFVFWALKIKYKAERTVPECNFFFFSLIRVCFFPHIRYTLRYKSILQ
ncbi:hypothetical protein M441DRAFT_290858 [Trichoderma asperellum CBS 433.97]|uniref:Uncharacterized protein n=1 Tax=Trichoderma asperellum (strain ATCC 204424 / CBS 433.97 / NBRC 101777) TaxID=1042311 RepID=A0A2T3YTX5_TRIA4|nr:hypothetical protein M441DRAFT_290858 [Trichoderma asperellum CBS 433.97]PTB36030.1 hypothetical protein M441DRAFT_290858 [Trichoderma asperellum CBS 433.97]